MSWEPAGLQLFQSRPRRRARQEIETILTMVGGGLARECESAELLCPQAQSFVSAVEDAADEDPTAGLGEHRPGIEGRREELGATAAERRLGHGRGRLDHEHLPVGRPGTEAVGRAYQLPKDERSAARACAE